MSNDIIYTIQLEPKDGFDLRLDCLIEYSHPDDLEDFENEEQRREHLRKIDLGLITWFCAKVTASRNGIDLASDYLGGCCYDSYEDFAEDSYCMDMQYEAIKRAREVILSLYDSETVARSIVQYANDCKI
jgi:hypothetical protein